MIASSSIAFLLYTLLSFDTFGSSLYRYSDTFTGFRSNGLRSSPSSALLSKSAVRFLKTFDVMKCIAAIFAAACSLWLPRMYSTSFEK